MYVLKSPIGACARRALGALLLLQFGEARGPVSPSVADPARNADNVKGASLLPLLRRGRALVGAGMDLLLARRRRQPARGLSQERDIDALRPGPRDDGRRERRRLDLGRAEHARVSPLLAPRRHRRRADPAPRLLGAGALGARRRRAAAAAAPALGPRRGEPHRRGDPQSVPRAAAEIGRRHHRSPDDPRQADRLRHAEFLPSCNKCARECPSGAITAGPKLMYNGYEIWKSDAEKCARYRLTNQGGGMCGRCMKTCPWNLEGLFADTRSAGRR